jgi:signal transduction histidine kinase
VALGVALFLATHNALAAVRDGMLAIAAIVGGIAIVMGPLWWRLVRDLTEERRERIRSQERAEVAAHLHDSVLQTLSLIQRNAGDSRTVTTLARKQERELRSWLFPPAAATARDESLATAVERVAGEIEEHHRVAVDAVTVGDCPLDDALAVSVLPAAREALINAAQHGGVENVSLYVEVEPDRVTVFVRDRGGGFDPAAVDGDRQGIAESIVGRMARHGGTGIVRSERGQGTEVQLVLPRGSRR